MNPPENSYDELPYEDSVIPRTHIDRLATVATLLGLSPPPVEQCRVLELGCAGGGNLLAMAMTLPGSRFVGIDLSERQIADGQKVIHAIGVPHVELHAKSILDIADDFGMFDYIICHGVYSWVPSAVQQKILDVCRQRLTPSGLAYISYNVYPGWHIRKVAREAMGFFTRNIQGPVERVSKGLGFLNFLEQSAPESRHAYRAMLKSEVDLLGEVEGKTSYIFHEYLEEVNEPIYFEEFARRLADSQLQYVADAELDAVTAQIVPAETAEVVERLTGNRIEFEQALDFVRGRLFRRSVIGRLESRPEPSVKPERVYDLFVTSLIRKAPAGEMNCDETVEFAVDPQRTFSTNDRVLKIALRELQDARPGSLAFANLWDRVRERLQASGVPSDEAIRQRLASSLLVLDANGYAVLQTTPNRFPSRISERPMANPLAYYQAISGRPAVATLHRGMIALNDFQRLVLCHLNGERDRSQLIDALSHHCAKGGFQINHGEQPVRDPTEISRLLEPLVDECMQGLLENALLFR